MKKKIGIQGIRGSFHHIAVENYFDKGSYVKIDINNYKESFDIIDTAINNPNIINMENIKDSRRLVLLDYNMLSIINSAITKFQDNII